MRTANFRDDVLWAIAYKVGLDPAVEFLTDEAESLASYINAWVRRTWDSTDHPEWTTIKEFSPDPNHQVPWAAVPVGATDPVVLSRPLKVYLVDPRLSPYPIDTRFREWDEGLHVGFDHGATVWIKYLGLAPKFTSTKWDASRNYLKGDLTYSPPGGECYKSTVNSNLGHDPELDHEQVLLTTLTQASRPSTPGIPEQKQIMYAYVRPQGPGDPGPPGAGTDFEITITAADGTTVLGHYVYTMVAGDTLTTVIDAMVAGLDTIIGLDSFTITGDHTNLRIQLEDASAFRVTLWQQSRPTSPGGPVHIYHNILTQAQTYLAAVPSDPGQPQIVQLTLGAQVRPCAAYELVFNDPEGDVHSVTYHAMATDGAPEILAGLVNAINTSSDPFFQTITLAADTNLGILTIASISRVSVSASMTPETSVYWELVPFPLALVEPVVRGAYSDALREAGQTDKALAEEQGAVQEQGDRMTKALAPGYTDLTDQRAPAPRYRGKLAGQNPAAAGVGK